jgi:hypothetical protein
MSMTTALYNFDRALKQLQKPPSASILHEIFIYCDSQLDSMPYRWKLIEVARLILFLKRDHVTKLPAMKEQLKRWIETIILFAPPKQKYYFGDSAEISELLLAEVLSAFLDKRILPVDLCRVLNAHASRAVGSDSREHIRRKVTVASEGSLPKAKATSSSSSSSSSGAGAPVGQVVFYWTKDDPAPRPSGGNLPSAREA